MALKVVKGTYLLLDNYESGSSDNLASTKFITLHGFIFSSKLDYQIKTFESNPAEAK